jgi:hypothetical protein
VFLGVEGAVEESFVTIDGIAVGRARKNRCEGSKLSSRSMTTAEAPAT